jgi:integrase
VRVLSRVGVGGCNPPPVHPVTSSGLPRNQIGQRRAVAIGAEKLPSDCVRLGSTDLLDRDLRHTGLTWMADAGVPVHVLRKIAGHGSLTTTQRYLHPDRQSIDAAGTALSAHLSARRSPNGPRLRVV